jgi:hypothetical protein
VDPSSHGLKGSGPYLQRSMSNTVLAGLVYPICELYIDDVLIHGRDIKSFLTSVRKLFEVGTSRGKAVKSAEISVTRNSKESVTVHRINKLLQGPCV